jgi:hypothetical protein
MEEAELEFYFFYCGNQLRASDLVEATSGFSLWNHRYRSVRRPPGEGGGAELILML